MSADPEAKRRITVSAEKRYINDAQVTFGWMYNVEFTDHQQATTISGSGLWYMQAKALLKICGYDAAQIKTMLEAAKWE